MLTFFPYLFDSQDAWEQTIADINYRYDMTLDEFMIIYGKYRKEDIHKNIKDDNGYVSVFELPKLTKISKRDKEIPLNSQEILNQSEIDELLKSFH